MKFVTVTIKVIAVLMFVIGVIMFFVAQDEARYASYGFYGKHSTDVLYWKFISVQSIVTAISSVFVYGFSYIVEAACKYLRKDENVEVEE